MSKHPVSTKHQKNKRHFAFLKDRAFRFKLSNFKPGGDASLRRFSIVEASLLLIFALLASRGLGVIRQVIFNAMFGTGAAANAYVAASNLPDTLYNLIAGGALTHAFIPVFFSYEKRYGQQEAWRLTSLVFNVLLVGLTLVVIIGEIFTPFLVRTFVVPGYSPAEQELTANLTRIMLLQPLILGLGTIGSAVLNSKRQFWLPALSIAVYNFGLIGGLFISLLFHGVGIYGPTYGVWVAAFLQVGIQIPGLLKQGIRYSFVWNLKDPGLHEVMRLLLPNALSVGIASIAFVMNTAFASYLTDSSSLAALHNAQMLYALPVALISQAIGQALLPHLVTHATAGRYVRMRQTAFRVMGVSIALTIPAALALIILGKPFIYILFQHGAFKQHSSDLTYLALIGFALGVPGFAGGEMLVNGFFALKDTRTPLLTNIFSLALRFGLTMLLLNLLLHTTIIIMAIPLATSGASIIETIILAIVLLIRLHFAVRKDQGMLRLQRYRLWQETRRQQEESSTSQSEPEAAKL